MRQQRIGIGTRIRRGREAAGIIGGCRNVFEFDGVVFDDTRKYLMSWLHKFPTHSVAEIFETATSRSMMVPWKFGETGAMHITSATFEIYEERFVAGAGDLRSTNV